jgi:hypothetical protein
MGINWINCTSWLLTRYLVLHEYPDPDNGRPGRLPSWPSAPRVVALSVETGNSSDGKGWAPVTRSLKPVSRAAAKIFARDGLPPNRFEPLWLL